MSDNAVMTLDAQAAPLATNKRPPHRFKPGNRFGGDRQIAQRARYVARLHKATDIETFDRIAKTLVRKAEDGVQWAVLELFDRLLGKATQHIDLTAQVQHSDGPAFDYQAFASRFVQATIIEQAHAQLAPPSVVPTDGGVIQEPMDTALMLGDDTLRNAGATPAAGLTLTGDDQGVGEGVKSGLDQGEPPHTSP